MNIRNLTALAGSLSLVALLSGCTPQARDDVSNAGSDLHAAASDSAKGTKQAIDNADAKAAADTKAVVNSTEQKVAKADDAVVNGTKTAVATTETAVSNTGAAISNGAAHAVHGTETAVADTGAAISNGAAHAVNGTEKVLSDTGAAVSKGTSAAVQGTERAAAKAGADTKDSAALLTLTPKVKSAILVDDRVKIADLNIDTKPADKEVVVNGTASSAEMKADALSDAKKELSKANPKYKIVDNIKVAK